MKQGLILLIVLANVSCVNQVSESDLIQNLENYLNAKAASDNSHWQFMADTVRTWFDEKSGEGNLQIKGRPSSGPWSIWDKEMHSYSTYDSLKANVEENSVTGIFVEHNDFYNLMGKTEGTKSRRTYWLNENGKVKEVLIEWVRGNITTDQYLEPIVEWALEKDSAEIHYLYKDKNITPSKEHADRWKLLLERYNKASK